MIDNASRLEGMRDEGAPGPLMSGVKVWKRDPKREPLHY